MRLMRVVHALLLLVAVHLPHNGGAFYHAIIDLDPNAPRLRLVRTFDEFIDAMHAYSSDFSRSELALKMRWQARQESVLAARKYIERKISQNRRSDPIALGDLCADHQVVDDPLDENCISKLWVLTLMLHTEIVGEIRLRSMDPKKLALAFIHGQMLKVTTFNIKTIAGLPDKPHELFKYVTATLLQMLQDYMPVHLKPLGTVWSASSLQRLKVEDGDGFLGGDLVGFNERQKVLTELGFVEDAKGHWCRFLKMDTKISVANKN